MHVHKVALEVGLLTAPLFAPAQNTSIDTSKWKVYQNAKYGFELKYPDNWHVNLSEGATWPAGRPTQRTEVTMIDVRKPHKEDDPAIYLTVGIQENENPQRLSIDDHFAQQLAKMKDKPEKSGRTTISGQPAIWMENTNSFGTHHDTFILLHQTNLVSLDYRRQPEFDAIFSAIVSSFRVLK